VLFEHATGYALLRVKEFEEIGLLQAQVEESVVDVTRFSSIIKLVAFAAFRSGPNALDNINSISEGSAFFSVTYNQSNYNYHYYLHCTESVCDQEFVIVF